MIFIRISEKKSFLKLNHFGNYLKKIAQNAYYKCLKVNFNKQILIKAKIILKIFSF